MSFLLALSRLIDAINEKIGLAVSWALLVAVLICSGNAIVRYSLEHEFQRLAGNPVVSVLPPCSCWPAPIPCSRNEHVRIDVIVGRFSKRTQVWIDVLGFLFSCCRCRC